MIPLMAIEVLGFLPGVPGLFLAGVVSAALSTLSSCYNSVAVSMTRDVAEQVHYYRHKAYLSDKTANTVAKVSSK